MDIADAVISVTRGRWPHWLVADGGAHWQPRLGRLPLTTENIKARIDEAYEQDGAKVAGMLQRESSQSCAISRKMGVDRPIIREAP